MKLSNILPFSAFIASSLAQTFTLPSLADGSYIISLDSSGNQVATSLATDNTTTVTQRDVPLPVVINSRINKRFNWPSGTYPWCPGGDWFLQSDFYDHGFSAFWDSCAANGAHKFPAGTVFANYQGTSVSYMCSYTTNPCSTDEWSDAVNWAASNCHGRSNGWMEPGYLHVSGWNKRYGYAKAGAGIC
ncbi:hypothetical protein GE09DRAFT_1047562 [Coniochaeta sp. 2T2.1]|nr:hypothetical protein GE09DRAFT_1047562 [Coniochaeta sp. 2T2.1]